MGVIGKTLRFVVGLGVGAAVGAAATLVVAPQSGRISREEIQGRLNAAKDAARKAQHDREKELQEYWEQEINVKYHDDEKKEKADKKDDK